MIMSIFHGSTQRKAAKKKSDREGTQILTKKLKMSLHTYIPCACANDESSLIHHANACMLQNEIDLTLFFFKKNLYILYSI